MGVDYDVLADFKLVDKNGEPIACNSESNKLLGGYKCPIFMWMFWVPDGDKLKIHSGLIQNIIKKKWLANDFNAFKGSHHVSFNMKRNSVRDELRLIGPPAGTDVSRTFIGSKLAR